MITDSMIASAVVPDTQKFTGLPTGIPRFTLRVWRSGRRQWLLKVGNTSKSPGEHPKVSIEVALAWAAEQRGVHKAAREAPLPVPTVTVSTAVRAAIAVPSGITFGEVAQRWLTYKAALPSRGNTQYKRAKYVGYLCEHLGTTAYADVTVPLALKALEAIAAEHGASSTGRHIASYAANVCDFAVSRGLGPTNPFARRKGWIAVPEVTNRAAIKDPESFGTMAEKIDLWQSEVAPTASNALKFLLRVPARVDALSTARWADMRIENGSPRWEIPADRMKGGKLAHVIPLPPQAVAILREQKAARPKSLYVFPHRDRDDKPMHADNPLRALQRLGYKQTAHGLRSSFSALTRAAFGREETDPTRPPTRDSRVIELCLAHVNKNQVEAAYDDSTDPLHRMKERRALMNWWAQEVERLSVGVHGVQEA